MDFFNRKYDTQFEGSVLFKDGDFFINGKRKSGIIGLCSLPRKKIQIKRSTWTHMSDLRREALMLHELGHCHFYLAHTTAMHPNGCPASLMHPKILPEACYRKMRNYYLGELAYRRAMAAMHQLYRFTGEHTHGED